MQLSRTPSCKSFHTPDPGAKLGEHIVKKMQNTDVHETPDTQDLSDSQATLSTSIAMVVHNFSATVLPLLGKRPRSPDSKRPRSPDSQATITETSNHPRRKTATTLPLGKRPRSPDSQATITETSTHPRRKKR